MKNPSASFSRASRSGSDHSGTLGRGGSVRARAGGVAEEGGLARLELGLARLDLAVRGVQPRQELGPVPEGVHGTGGDEGLAGALVQGAGVDALQEVEERREGPRGARVDDGLHRAGTHAPHGAQAEADLVGVR